MLKNCVKCGRCLSVCPIYKISGHERLSPRGKLNLIELYQEGILHPSPLFIETISACISCGQCEKRCVLNLPIKEIIHQLREKLWPHQKIQFYRAWLISNILASRGILWRLLAMFKQFSPLPFSFAQKPFLPQNIKSSGKKTVGIFVGCITNFIYPHLGYKLLKLLKYLNYEIFIPNEQVCCGLMAYNLGDREIAFTLAQKNIDAFKNKKIDFILTPCASCYHHLTTFSLYQETGLSKKVMELNRFLFNNKIPFIFLNQKLTWHDPCHLYYHHNIWEEPRELLKKIGIFVESSPNGMCCGQGGSFSINFPELSKKMLEKRINFIKKTKADIVVTNCMGCLIQLKTGLGKEKVKHILELIA